MMIHSPLCYRVGPLLYCPAVNQSIANSLAGEKFGTHYSLALCLEDTIDDDSVAEAEEALLHSLNEVSSRLQEQRFYLPDMFIRVREPQQIPRLFQALGAARSLIRGFIIPKITPTNADAYIHEIRELNRDTDKPVFMMPIIESSAVVNLQHRYEFLYTLKEQLDTIKELVLNVRVGGNDLCNAFGFRRQSNESIHEIRPVINILSDIVTVFGMDYVISGPVWEYYSGPGWDSGLAAELKQDRLMGFVGKTVIHPHQIPLVNQAYLVSRADYEDAQSILGWDKKAMVSGSVLNCRMNEYKTHVNWAQRMIGLAEAYGIAD